MQYRKVYVAVTLNVTEDGQIRPTSITWEDGQVYEIDKVRCICNASSLKVGGCGVRYTVVIGSRQTYLYNEDNRWFVEAKPA